MRNFIVSDLHGDGNIYNSIISYIENVEKDSNEEVCLYINGDLIDRGYECGEMLLDVRDRILNKRGFKIEYLAGNHEMMMYDAEYNNNSVKWPTDSLWFYNGGAKTAYSLEMLVDNKEYHEVVNFISNLKLYHKFDEKLDGKNIVLAHSKCPTSVTKVCNLRLIDNTKEGYDIVWTRKDYDNPCAVIGNKRYFTIIGHTPVYNYPGFYYDKEENFLNIDGGCAAYVLGGKDKYDHVPLVEIDSKNNRLIILIFNNNNEIIDGYYFSNKKSTKIRNLDKYRKYIKKDIKLKTMSLYEGMIFFD